MDSEEAQALLESGHDGVIEWNRRRDSGAQEPLRLSFQNSFSYGETSPLDLRGADLGGCSLAGSELDGADLGTAHLYRAILRDTALFGCNLSDAQLAGADLVGSRLGRSRFDRANLAEADLGSARGPASFVRARMQRAVLSGAEFACSDFLAADLRDGDLDGAMLEGSRLDGSDLSGARLSNACLRDASLIGANLDGADLRGADLSGAILDEARMIDTDLRGARLDGCSVYGISAWNLKTDATTSQRDLNIGRRGESAITVDDLEMAQFVYLLMDNSRLRSIIDTITSKVVLILGRFSETRMPVLNAMRDALRTGEFDFVPVVFDFDKPASRSTAETVATLAGMARFVIADLTEAKSVLQELREIVPTSPSVPVQPLLLRGDQEPGMLDFFRRYPWFLEPFEYSDAGELLAGLAAVIDPAVRMSDELRGAARTAPGGKRDE